MQFTKMQGLGNDYIYVDRTKEEVINPSELAVALSDRHFGIGSDGLILVGESQVADARMDMYNADGSRGMMCGNGIRCVAKYVYEHGWTDTENINIETLSGIKETIILPGGSVRVNMGVPTIESYGGGVDYISMGNPHAVVYMEHLPEIPGMSVIKPRKVKELGDLNLGELGPLFEMHRGIDKRVNVEFVHVFDRHTIEMRVWEKGSGETLACGTGACAATVSSILRNLTERKVLIKLLGGDLLIEWSETDGNVYMTGPAVTVFEGEINL